MPNKEFEFVSVQPEEVVGYASGIALQEAMSDGVLTVDQMKKIVTRTIELTQAMFTGKFINPDESRPDKKYWVISDTPDPRAPQEVKDAAERETNVLEIGG